jgi:hypothetical protein
MKRWLRRKLRSLRRRMREWDEAVDEGAQRRFGPSDEVPIIQGGYRLGDDDKRTPWSTR